MMFEWKESDISEDAKKPSKSTAREFLRHGLSWGLRYKGIAESDHAVEVEQDENSPKDEDLGL